MLFLDESELICLYPSISVVCTQLNGSIQIVVFSINHLFDLS